MKTTIIPQAIVITLLLVFTMISLRGAWLVYKSQLVGPTTINSQVSAEGLKLNITSAIPGIIIFVIGGVGLILLLIKVPVKRILGYEAPKADTTSRLQTFTLGGAGFSFPRPILADKIENVPLLLLPFIRNDVVKINKR